MSTKTKKQKEQRALALSNLYARGYTLGRAARLLNVSNQTVRRTIYGITKNPILLKRIKTLPPIPFTPLKFN